MIWVWRLGAVLVRAAFRRPYQTTYRSLNLGFRPARTLQPAE
jgi:hypothetical protein